MTLTCKTTFTTLPSPARVSSLENQITVRSHRNDHNHLIGPSFIITLGDILQLFTRTPSLLTPLISLLSLCLFLTLCASLPYSLGDYFSQGDGDNTKAEQSVTCDSALKLRERSCLQAGEPWPMSHCVVLRIWHSFPFFSGWSFLTPPEFSQFQLVFFKTFRFLSFSRTSNQGVCLRHWSWCAKT